MDEESTARGVTHVIVGIRSQSHRVPQKLGPAPWSAVRTDWIVLQGTNIIEALRYRAYILSELVPWVIQSLTHSGISGTGINEHIGIHIIGIHRAGRLDVDPA